MSTQLSNLDISIRLNRILTNHLISNLSQLTDYTTNEIKNWPDMSSFSHSELATLMTEHKLQFKH